MFSSSYNETLKCHMRYKEMLTSSFMTTLTCVAGGQIESVSHTVILELLEDKHHHQNNLNYKN